MTNCDGSTDISASASEEGVAGRWTGCTEITARLTACLTK